MGPFIQLSATSWLNITQVTMVVYEPEEQLWRVRLCGQSHLTTLAPDEGAALAYYLRQKADREAYNQTQREQRERAGTVGSPKDGP